MASVSLDLEHGWKGQNSLDIRLEAPETSGSYHKVRTAGGLQAHGLLGAGDYGQRTIIEHEESLWGRGSQGPENF